MKILLVIETSCGGSGIHVIELAEFLVRVGHDVHIIYSSLRMDDNFAGSLHKLLTANTFDLHMKQSIHPSDIINIIRIRRYILANGGFDIVHGHSSKGGAMARLATLFHRCRRIYTPHAFVTMNPTLGKVPLLLYRGVEFLLAKFATEMVIVVSEDERLHALDLGIPSGKIVIIPPGIRTETLSNRNDVRVRLGLTSGDFCVGWVGRYVPQKATERVIKAAAEILVDCPNLRLVLLGDGPLEPQLRALAKELGLEGRVSWLKGLTGPDVMPAFDVFMLTSLYEGMPRVILEALADGVPIVAMESGGVKMVVRSGIEGYVVPAGDMVALVNKLRRLALDPELRGRMQTAARKSVTEFSIERMTEQILDVYHSELAKATRRTSDDAPY